MSEQYRKWTGLVSSLHNSNRYYQLFQYTVWLLLVLIVYRINQNIICRKRLLNIRMYYVYYIYTLTYLERRILYFTHLKYLKMLILLSIFCVTYFAFFLNIWIISRKNECGAFARGQTPVEFVRNFGDCACNDLVNVKNWIKNSGVLVFGVSVYRCSYQVTQTWWPTVQWCR